MMIFCHISKNPWTNKILRSCLKTKKFIQMRVSHCTFHLIYPGNKNWIFMNYKYFCGVHQILSGIEIQNSNFDFLLLSKRVLFFRFLIGSLGPNHSLIWSRSSIFRLQSLMPKRILWISHLTKFIIYDFRSISGRNSNFRNWSI